MFSLRLCGWLLTRDIHSYLGMKICTLDGTLWKLEHVAVLVRSMRCLRLLRSAAQRGSTEPAYIQPTEDPYSHIRVSKGRLTHVPRSVYTIIGGKMFDQFITFRGRLPVWRTDWFDLLVVYINTTQRGHHGSVLGHSMRHLLTNKIVSRFSSWAGYRCRPCIWKLLKAGRVSFLDSNHLRFS
jgi:hypothetical protein